MFDVKKKLMLLASFIRIKICISAVIFSATGYLLFNDLSSNIAWVLLSSFLVCAGAYSINNITDKGEDYINRERTESLASGARGKIVTATAFSLGFFFSLFLTPVSTLFYLIAAATSVAYSVFRIKRYVLVKNLYTGFGVMQVFLIGAANSPLTIETAVYYISFSIFIMIGSMISDLRDYKGDKLVGHKTLPVRIGYDFTRNIVMILLIFYAIFVLLIFPQISILVPFIIIIFPLLYKDRIFFAHFFGGLPFVFIVIWLLL